MRFTLLSITMLLIVLVACRQQPPVEGTSTSPLFTSLPASETGIDFRNLLTEGPNTNILMYEYFYNGGGVAAGDINNDGLIDLYFSSNMDRGKLYLNTGDMKFKDITSVSGVIDRAGPWKTGTSMADVNGDGLLDIFLAYSGMIREENRTNQLFINQGNNADGVPVFKEQAQEYGLASPAFTNLAYFFDYDNDGDLDAVLLNHNPRALPVLNEVSTAELLRKDDPYTGVRLLRQTDGRFEDITTQSGINGSALTYGLGAGIADFNNDGWYDVYISNDYAVPDYLYINNGDGTFTDRLKQSMGHSSHFSMGNDVADINNDGLIDILTLDMLPEDNQRQKLLLSPDNYGKFDFNVKVGFHYQYMRNMLQLNNGNGTFSEVGQIAGVSNTDWSWAALLADYNNDGWKDLVVTNGYFRDYTNLDFVKYMDDYVAQKGRLMREDVLDLITRMPASRVSNYIFSGNQNMQFTNRTSEWGLRQSSNSNGAVYADLDNDGDLDLVVSNINEPAFVYRNNTDSKAQHFLQVKLAGNGKNTNGIGARVTIATKGLTQHLEQMPARGYLSSVSPVLHFGLGNLTTIDSLLITWPGGKSQLLTAVAADQVVELNESDATLVPAPKPSTAPVFQQVTNVVKTQVRKASDVNDFKRQPLIINPFSFSGPCLVKGDINNDGREDLFVGGVAGQPAEIHLQVANGSFLRKSVAAFGQHSKYEDADAAIFDANGDGHMDIYVASGGYHQLEANDPLLDDRLYLGDGKGNFQWSREALPQVRGSKGCVEVIDVNGDGFMDVFVGGRVVPGRYPEIPQSYLLINNGKGIFADQASSFFDSLPGIGMVTDALAIDLNNDQRQDLVLVGEWMPIIALINDGKSLENKSQEYFGEARAGWWNRIAASDLNGDGVQDFVLGNMGLNTQFRASSEQPLEMYFKDYDDNGFVDPIFCYYIQGKSYPYVTRDEMLEQIGAFRKRYTNYESYADVTLDKVFKPEELGTFSKLTATHMETSLFMSNGAGRWDIQSLPIEAQYSPVCNIVSDDFDGDGAADLVLTGNINRAKLRLGKLDANYGVLLKGNGKGQFKYISQPKSGLDIRGDVRGAVVINNQVVLGINGVGVEVYGFGGVSF